MRKTFEALGLGDDKVEVWSGDKNGQAVQEADLILLAYVSLPSPSLPFLPDQQLTEIVIPPLFLNDASCKPQLARGLIEALPREALEGKLLISIAAGLTIGQMKQWVPESCVVVRAMPNTPSRVRLSTWGFLLLFLFEPCASSDSYFVLLVSRRQIRQGMTVLTPVPADTHLPTIPSPTKLLHLIFDSVGRTLTLEEKFFDVCTALSGSGPAFACMFIESLADGAVMCGLPRRESLEMAAQMMQGAARMILETGTHPAQLRDQVTTPGGCTIAGLLCLEDGKVRSTIARTVEVAAKQ